MKGLTFVIVFAVVVTFVLASPALVALFALIMGVTKL